MKKEEDYDEIANHIVEEYIPKEKLPAELFQNLTDFILIRKELMKESDRGCALLAASQLEFSLERLLRKKLLGSKKHKDAMFSFNGCLGTFSSRIQLAYSIGLIPKIEKDGLELIRKIRNEFGHSQTIIDFNQSKIDSLCAQIELFRPSNKTNRSKFLASVSYILGGLMGRVYKEIPFAEIKKPLKEEIELSAVSTDLRALSLFDKIKNTPNTK